MKAANFDLQKYFARIGFNGEAKADIDTVGKIMRCQLFSVPFENLDVQAGKIVSLTPEEIVDKILERKRGGYCYEVNGIFAMALQTLGVPYQFVAARPMFTSIRRPKTHMAIVAKLDGKEWLCDLGFGSYGPRSPMLLSLLDAEVKQDFDIFMLSKIRECEFLLQARVDGEWVAQYAFDLYPQEWIDFIPANYMNSTHPDGLFVKHLLVVLHNPEGRNILFGSHLKIVTQDRTEQRLIKPEERESVLRDIFLLHTGT